MEQNRLTDEWEPVIANDKKFDRQADIDCLKGIGIVLVVAGHFIEPYREFQPVFNCIFLIIYSFHMPLFCFFSGYVAKFNIKRLGKTALIYIGASVFYYLFRIILWDEIFSIKGMIRNIVYPWWHLWYLEALVIWGMLLFIINKRVNRLLVICLVLIISLASGYFEIPFLLSRAIVFFPFYLVGYLYKEEIRIFLQKNRLKYKISNTVGLLFILPMIFIICIYNDKINTESFFNWQSYQAGEYTLQNRMMYLIGAFFILSSIILIFRGGIKFKSARNLGKKTLPVYIFHAGIFWLLNNFGINEKLIAEGKVSLIILYISTCVIGCILIFPLLYTKPPQRK